MKSIRFFLILLAAMLGCMTLNAQDAKDEFAGSWEFKISGVSSEDLTMIVNLERGEDGNLTGFISQPNDTTKINLSRVVEKKGESFTIYFESSGYDCYLEAKKTDEEGKLNGLLMDMFDAKGTRINEETQQAETEKKD